MSGFFTTMHNTRRASLSREYGLKTVHDSANRIFEPASLSKVVCLGSLDSVYYDVSPMFH